MLSHAEFRDLFPALKSGFSFLENAGGSQVPQTVIDAVPRYFRESYVQLGAGYPASDRATAIVEEAHTWMTDFMGGTGAGQVVIGPSTTQLVTMLATAYGEIWQPGDEVILCETAHEGNAGPWTKLARHGINIKWWKVDPENLQCSLEDLEALISPRTKLLAFPHVSNLLGEVVDVAAITALAHRHGVKVVVDGVAFAAHQAMEVARWNVDWYVFSTYKVFGPHQACLFGRFEAFAELRGPNHFFLPEGTPYKFELGGANHEACAALLGVREFFGQVAGVSSVDRAVVEAVWSQLFAWERPLTAQLFEGLSAIPGVRVFGPLGVKNRVGTVSFRRGEELPAETVRRVNGPLRGIRYGHMYAYRLCGAIGIPPEEGVVRVSLVSYNSAAEVAGLLNALS
jgi:cysteine desulfurase family protein (TIGR01976 family)